MQHKLFIILVSLLVTAFATVNAQVAKSIKGNFALTNATIYTITKGTLENATLVIENGKITGLGGSETVIPRGATIIDCKGLSIYPGLIDAGTNLGLSEVGSISLTKDYNEVGDFNPHMQALTAVNPNSVAIPVTRTNGVTTVITKPSGGIFPGTAALINLNGYSADHMYAGFKGMVINYPSSGSRGRWDRRSEEDPPRVAGRLHRRRAFPAGGLRGRCHPPPERGRGV